MNQSANENPKPHLSALEKIDKILLECDEAQRELLQSDVSFVFYSKEQHNQSAEEIAFLIRQQYSSTDGLSLITSEELGLSSKETYYLSELARKFGYLEHIETIKTRDSYDVIFNNIYQLGIEGYKRIAELRNNKNNFLKQLSSLQWSNWLSVIIGLAALFLAIPAIQRFFHIN
jgi:hypothetical protein